MNTQIDSHPGAAPAHKPASKPNKKLFGLLAVAIVVLLGLLYVGIRPRLQRNTALAQSVKQARSTVPLVDVITPQWVSEGGLSLPSNVQAIKETTMNARTTGYLRRLYVDIGSHIKTGQLLAEIESPDVDQQVYQAQAQTAQSQATVGQSQATVAQQRAGVVQMQAQVAQQSAVVEQARATLASTEAKLTQAQAAQGQAEAQLAHAQQALDVQKAALKQMQAQLDLAAVTNTRYQDLLKQGFVAQQDADTAAATLKTATAAVESAQASIQSAQADIQAAQQAVVASKAVVTSAQADVQASQKSVQASEAALTSSQATVQAAQASVQASLKNVQANQAFVTSNVANTRRYAVMRSFERVVAPFDGVITSRNVDVGTLISAGGSNSAPTSTAPVVGMFGIARTDEIRIQINVPQTYVATIRSGSKAQVTVREVPGRVFTGTVTLRAGALDATSRTQLVEVHLPNRDNVLVPGMYAQVHLAPSHPPLTLRIPGTALIIDGQGTRVAVVTAQNTLHLQPITIGRDFGTEVEITEGLKGTEKLVNNPSDTLQESQPVQVAATPPAGGTASTPPADGTASR
ncbi:MAG: family efflux transporter, subunit [Chthonomonadaceae bacterium]|nr:family efflux transporter, subunit [Chthonomonadaceae bacterium]